MKLSTVLVLAVYATHHFFTEAHDTSPKQNFLQDHLRKRRELLKPNIRSAAVQTHGDQRRLDTSWTLWGETINGSIQGGQFGYSVAISASGKVFAAGAPYATISSTGALTSLSSASGESLPIQNNGQVQVYQYINGQWTKAGTVDGTAGVEENLGTSVALSWDGTKLAVGVPEAQNAGLVRMYQYNSARNWVRMGQDLKGPDAASNARVGAAVAMSSDGEIVGIGAPDAYSNRGLVRVYRYSTSDSNWTRMGQDLEGETNGDKNGFALDLSADGHTIAIGSPDRKVGTRVRAGRVRVYRFSDRDGAWSQIGQNIVGPTSGDELGYDVSLSADGRRVAIGLPGRNGNSGVADVGGVKVYEYNSSQNQWTQVGDDIVGKQKDAMLGASLSLSAAGDDLSVLEVIGKEVRHYSFVDDTWRQVGNAIKDDIEPDRVALSADGNKIIVGEIDGTLTGRVQVYSFPNTLYDITLVNIEATFAESHAGTPEIKLYYVNSATLATGYYRMTILSPDCTTVDTTGAIKPILRANGMLPVTDPTASDITAQVDINTTIIQNTEYYFQAENDVDSGQIAFCAKIDYYDNNDQTLASDTSGIILELDFTSNWEIDGITGTRKSPGQTVHYVSFEYTTEAYFCDNNNQQVSPAPLYPGQSVQVCVRTPANSDVEVVALRSVTFKNSMAPLLSIVVIDGQGDATNSRTTTTCTDGICNLRTVTFNDLFEYDVDGNGSFEDVSDGVILEGRAILGFASQDGRRILMETNLGGGAKKTRTLQTIQVQEGNDSNNNDQNLQEAITSDGVMAETNFAVDVPLQRPPQGSSRYQRNSSADPSIGFIPTLIVAIVSTLILSL